MKIQIIWAILIILTSSVFGQSGGNFVITQSVIASGGGQNSNGGLFALDGTIAQTNTGTNPSGGNFGINSGFWLPQFAPTAANVSVGGRIITADGIGIRNVSVLLTSQSGQTKSAVSSSFGYYRFNDVAVGETYILTVFAKRFSFQQPTIVVSVNEELSNLDFVARKE